MSKENAFVLQEQNILSLCVRNPSFVYEVEPKYLISKTAKSIHTSIKGLAESNVTINSRTLYTEVSKEVEIHEELIKNLFEIDVQKEDFHGLYNSLKKQWAKVDIQNNIMKDILGKVTSKDEMDTDVMWEFKNSLEKRLIEIDDNRKKVYTLQQMFDVYTDELYERYAGEGTYDTGCSYLNENLQEGFAPTKITTIFGQSGVGKSTYALYLVNRQINKSIPSMYFSLEMPLISTMDRLVAQRAKIPVASLYPDLDFPEMDDYAFNIVNKEREKIENCNHFRFVEEENLSLSDIESMIERSKKEMGVDYMIATIDLLTMIRDFNAGKGSNKAELYENAMNGMHAMARRQNVHIVGVVQSKRPQNKVTVRSVDDVDHLRPGIEELKNSGAIEERSRVVLSTFRKKFFAQRYLPDDPETELLDDVMEIDIAKQNSGAQAQLRYLFEPESSYLCRFVEEEI